MLKGSETCVNENFEKRCHLSSTCAYVFEFSIVDIVDGAIYFLYKLIGNHWELAKGYGMLRGLLSISIDKI
jgi:hypothetical protein